MHIPDPELRSGLAAAEYAQHMIMHANRDGDAAKDHRLLPHLQQTSMLLAPEPTAPAEARAFVAHTMQDWQLPSLISPASQVLSEMVTRAAINGDAELEVRLSRVDTRIRNGFVDVRPDEGLGSAGRGSPALPPSGPPCDAARETRPGFAAPQPSG